MPTVLVVDDEPQVLKFLAQILRAEYTVITAQSGIEALSIYESYSDWIDFIVTDVTMPGMSGVELVRRLDTLYPRRPLVIFVSGGSDLPLGAAGAVLRKPFSAAELKETIHRALQVDADRP